MSSALARVFFASSATWEAPYGTQQRALSVKCCKCLPQETNKKQNSHKQPKFTPKETRKKY